MSISRNWEDVYATQTARIAELESKLAAIEACFVAGRDAAEDAKCPHSYGTLAAHWWTRGFAYTARLLRAVRAEEQKKVLEARRD